MKILQDFLEFDYSNKEDLGALMYLLKEINRMLDSVEKREENLMNKYSAVPTEFLGKQIENAQIEAEAYRKVYLLIEACIRKIGG